MLHLKFLAAQIGRMLVVYGGWGLFVISFLDASFVPFPVFNDLALIVLASRHPSRAVFYALQSTAGSVLGAYVLYASARRGGEYLWRKSTPDAVTRAKQWVAKNDFVALFVASLLPPPAPLKVFVLAAGVLQMNALHFGIAMFVGRILRFGLDAFLGARYGPHAQAFLKQNLEWASLAAVVLVVGFTVVYRRWVRPRARMSAEKTSDSSSSGVK